MKKFQYIQIDYNHYPSAKELDEEGAHGWELLFVYQFEKTCFDINLEYHYKKTVYRATFKREII